MDNILNQRYDFFKFFMDILGTWDKMKTYGIKSRINARFPDHLLLRDDNTYFLIKQCLNIIEFSKKIAAQGILE